MLSMESAVSTANKVRRRLVLPQPLFRLVGRKRARFVCPVCRYEGPFRNFRPGTGLRIDAQCPCCRALERHRIQQLVLNSELSGRDTSVLRVLHVAPERFLKDYFTSLDLRSYETADLHMPHVDHHVDLCDLPFDDDSYDLIYASHVLEHIRNDHKAIAEIRRVLAPGGMAILPVPILGGRTVEYEKPNPYEEYHVRSPGTDYYDRYERYFDSVKTYRSSMMPEEAQTFIKEDRSKMPTARFPNRPSVPGDRHEDIVPVCRRDEAHVR